MIEKVHPVLMRAANTVEAEEHGLTALVLVEVALDIHINWSNVLQVDDMLTQLGLHDSEKDSVYTRMRMLVP